MAYTLYGALVGGPNAADEYYDLRDGELMVRQQKRRADNDIG